MLKNMQPCRGSTRHKHDGALVGATWTSAGEDGSAHDVQFSSCPKGCKGTAVDQISLEHFLEAL